MGGASHKLAGSHLTIRTTLSSADVLSLAERVASQVQKRRPDKPGPVVMTSKTASSADFAVVNVFKKAIMRFRVNIAQTQGGTEAHAQITYFTTMQQQMLGFIPAGPKRLNGWPAYSTFMESLQLAVSDADTASRTSIVMAAG